jgi:hypothetical protein
MPKCYIIQEPMRREGNVLAPVMDFRKVLEYGDPVVCLPHGRVSLAPGPTVSALKYQLRNFTDDDYMVSVGDPSAIFIAAMVVSEINNGRCKLLKWDRDAKRYIEVQVDLNCAKRRTEE